MRRKRGNRKKQKRFIFTLALLFTLVFFIGFKVVDHYKYISYVKETFAEEMEPNVNNKNIGQSNSFIDYNKKYIITNHYPEFSNEKINNEIEAFVSLKKDAFLEKIKSEKKSKKYVPNQYIDYEADKFGDNVASIKFKVEENIPSLNKHNLEYYTFVYDLDKSEKLGLNNFIFDSGYDFLSNYIISNLRLNENVNETLTEEILSYFSNDPNNYNDFLINDNNLNLVVLSNDNLPDNIKSLDFSIPLNDISDYVKFNLDTKTFLTDEEIISKKEELEKITGTRKGLDPNKPMIALTFDDGPYSGVTIPILDQLEKYNSAATFFMLGEKINQNKEILEKMVQTGSEVANHSYSHKQLTKLSIANLNKEINDTSLAIKNVVGFEPKLVRPTYGAVNNTVKANINYPLILWSIDTLDWKYRNTNRIVNHVLTNVKDGDIILMHDLYGTTRDATLQLIPKLIDRGFQLVTVSELFELKEVELKPGVTYSNVR